MNTNQTCTIPEISFIPDNSSIPKGDRILAFNIAERQARELGLRIRWMSDHYKTAQGVVLYPVEAKWIQACTAFSSVADASAWMTAKKKTLN